ncbi:hypothetical protein ACFSJ3_18255 [Corallincola platygyrae]|uniref:Integral membrane protein n=1 Tax=Corallincola platygyrae TaxID=1193278 RepID=A0ABW4XQU0_9GAMM
MSQAKLQARRWVWFLDVVFGAIVALGIQTYEPTIKAAWQLGALETVLSLVVAIAAAFFVVYDIVVYHLLVRKYRYTVSSIGFIRFFLDLVMAFILYTLLVSALQANPDWYAMLWSLTLWHAAATVWHLLAQAELSEPSDDNTLAESVGSHVVFILIYWAVAFVSYGFAQQEMASLELSPDSVALTSLSISILAVSALRWHRVLVKL